jgi:hypothetical protein
VVTHVCDDCDLPAVARTPYGDWCALRFWEPARAVADGRISGTGDLNPHSGKWNLQALDPVLTVAQRIALLEDRLRRAGVLEDGR